jgi:hypothetical protein
MWAAIPAGMLAALWVTTAIGSYVYLRGTDYLDEFLFPWDQLWIAIPWIIHDGWAGLRTLVVWEWALIGVGSAILPWGMALSFGIRRLRRNVRQPSLWGSTGFADRREMDRGGVKTRGKLF